MAEPRKPGANLRGLEYAVAFEIFSKDARRQVEVREFSNGETYLVERDWVEGTTFSDRHEGRIVGPFTSNEAAEKFVVATAWFRGVEE